MRVNIFFRKKKENALCSPKTVDHLKLYDKIIIQHFFLNSSHGQNLFKGKNISLSQFIILNYRKLITDPGSRSFCVDPDQAKL